MLSCLSQNDIKKIPTGRVYSKKQTRVTANQHIFNSGLISHKKNTHSLSAIVRMFEKHPSILNIEKGNLIDYFHSERQLKRRYRKLSMIWTLKRVVRRVTLPPKVSNRVPTFSHIWLRNILTTAFKANFRMIWNMLILFQCIRKTTNAKKKIIDQ